MAYGFWAYGFGRMVLGVWLSVYGWALGKWFWAQGFGSLVLDAWFWAYSFGHVVWRYDVRSTALQTRAGQAQKYIPVLNRKIKD